MDVKSASFEVQVFDTKVERFTDAQAAGVEQVDEQPCGIALGVLDVCQQLEGFAAVRAIAKAGWTFGTKRIDVSQLLFEGIAVEEEKSVEGLVLGGGRNTLHSEVCEECLHFGFGAEEGFALRPLEETGIVLEASSIGFLSAESGVVQGTRFL